MGAGVGGARTVLESRARSQTLGAWWVPRTVASGGSAFVLDDEKLNIKRAYCTSTVLLTHTLILSKLYGTSVILSIRGHR